MVFATNGDNLESVDLVMTVNTATMNLATHQAMVTCVICVTDLDIGDRNALCTKSLETTIVT